MYAAEQDRYCYPGTSVLKNIRGLRNPVELASYETAMTFQRGDEPLPPGRLSVHHYRAVHHHLFQDVYSWAGRFRTVRLAKSGSAFCYPEYIPREMTALFAALKANRFLRDVPAALFVRYAASFLSTLNAIHPFREGNGRSQLWFLRLVAIYAGHPFDLKRLEPEKFLAAMVASFRGDEEPLVRTLSALVRKS